MKTQISITGFILLMTACNQQAIDIKAEGEKLMQLSREWSKLAATKNVDTILSYWADDAVMFSAGEAPLKGKAAIRQMVQESFAIPGFSISWEPLSATVSRSGDLAYLLESAKITVSDSAGNPSVQQFNSVSIWKKQGNGQWKNVVDVMSPAKTVE